MLFNSFAFIFVYLPVTLAIFFLVARSSRPAAAGWLAFMSLVFYGWWDYRYLPLLLGSIAFNFWCGSRIGAAAEGNRKRWLVLGVVANLALLGYFKYADFFLSTLNAAADTRLPLLHIVLPIGISFFTFTQTAFLVDTYQRKVAEYNFIHYLLFVTYFPHLIAGPVLHHKEMMPQFADEKIYTFSQRSFAIGLTFFIFGLAKKVLLADNLAEPASRVFDQTPAPSLLVAWGGVLAYTFQLYFDFSGYSDMAIGLSLMIGVKLPLNFNSPYKAANISEFWQRWHMTLSRFLRDYLYIPLGGNRKGPIRRYINLVLTMLLGGLWHGAGWNFVIWGALHGFYLCVHHTWEHISTRLHIPALPRFASVFITFLAVCLAWVFFRAADFDTALAVSRGMAGAHGIALPDALGAALGPGRSWLEATGVSFYLGGGQRFIETWGWIAIAMIAAFLLPNTQQMLSQHVHWLDRLPSVALHLTWSANRFWAAVIGSLALLSLLSLNRPSAFLYFQF